MYRSLRVALETQRLASTVARQIALETKAKRFPKGRVVGWGRSFYRGFVVIPTDLY
ncbi:hypothetical protein [Leptospira kirschneri]|uniref:hypothetical protein n=1 Tax=Leptospira kirschneri TaxID=29507 RepID=UPI0015911CDA|nr:hypothetical protein [Leptospira kirschneri]